MVLNIKRETASLLYIIFAEVRFFLDVNCTTFMLGHVKFYFVDDFVLRDVIFGGVVDFSKICLLVILVLVSCRPLFLMRRRE